MDRSGERAPAARETHRHRYLLRLEEGLAERLCQHRHDTVVAQEQVVPRDKLVLRGGEKGSFSFWRSCCWCLFHEATLVRSA